MTHEHTYKANNALALSLLPVGETIYQKAMEQGRAMAEARHHSRQ